MIVNRWTKKICILLALLLALPGFPLSARAEEEAAEPVKLLEMSDSCYEIPLYLQNDYPYARYGAGTVASSGCSVTCLAMVATYLTGHEYLPDELARYFGGSSESNLTRLENGADTMQLPYYKSKNYDKTMEAMRNGKIAIVLMEYGSKFTSTQHFIVLTGMTEDGKVMVHDPYEPNYDKWDLKQGFRTGFDPYDLLAGYSGAWIFDKDAMPDEPFLYSEPEIDKSNPRYPDIELTFEETELLARVVWAEARGECPEGQQAVAEVTLNRMASDNFPDTLYDVIYGQGQYRTIEVLEDAEPYQAQFDAIEKAIYGPHVVPEDVMHFATYPVNEYVWGEIGGHVFCYDWSYGNSMEEVEEAVEETEPEETEEETVPEETEEPEA